MSHPIIGNNKEVFGTYECPAHVVSKLDLGQVEFSIPKDEFNIEHDYFKSLYEEGKITPILEIKDGATFLSKKFEGFGPHSIDMRKFGGVVDISTYLAVKEDFDFDPPKGSVDEFFLGITTIKKGYKLSVPIVKKWKPSFINSKALNAPISYILDDSAGNSYNIEWTNAQIEIKVGGDVHRKLEKLLKSKPTKSIVINAFFGHILIEAIRIMALSDHIDLQWSKLLQEKLEVDVNPEDVIDYKHARELYLELFEEDDFWASSLEALVKLKSNT